MKFKIILIGLSLALLALSAQAKSNRIDYAAYAGDPIPEFRYYQLYNWQRTGDKTLVVWTKPSTAYLLTTRSDCYALPGRVTIQIGGVDGMPGRLKAGSDNVIIGQLRCRVIAIQPLDLQRLKADRVAHR